MRRSPSPGTTSPSSISRSRPRWGPTAIRRRSARS
jgi:hypothetical protein